MRLESSLLAAFMVKPASFIEPVVRPLVFPFFPRVFRESVLVDCMCEGRVAEQWLQTYECRNGARYFQTKAMGGKT